MDNKNNNNNIGIIGCGKLGICYASCFARANYNVYCYDINDKISANIINDSYNYYEPNLNTMIKDNKHKFIFTDDLREVINNCDIIFSFINTPSLPDGSYNHEYINNFIDNCISFGKQEINKLIVISSTVAPEYCDSLVEKTKDYNYDICYNPSFIAQGSIIMNIIYPEFIIIGANNDDYYEKIINIYDKIIENPNIHYNKLKLYEAEVAKIVNNCFITMKISFVNLVGDLIKSKGYEPERVLKSLSTNSNFGKINMKYGFGYGGPCLPRDNRAFHNYIKTHINDKTLNFDLCLMNDLNNKNHLQFQFNELKNQKEPIEFKYITYKDSSDILEESQKLELAKMLYDNGNQVVIYERPEIIEILKKINPKFIFKEIDN